MNAELVTLADGFAVQTLVPGVAPVSEASRGVALEMRRRAARRDHRAPPAGGLFDDTARAQVEMF